MYHKMEAALEAAEQAAEQTEEEADQTSQQGDLARSETVASHSSHIHASPTPAPRSSLHTSSQPHPHRHDLAQRSSSLTAAKYASRITHAARSLQQPAYTDAPDGKLDLDLDIDFPACFQAVSCSY